MFIFINKQRAIFVTNVKIKQIKNTIHSSKPDEYVQFLMIYSIDYIIIVAYIHTYSRYISILIYP